MNAEDVIRQKTGKDSPFRVPDGYFEDFAAIMMQKIDEETKQKKHARTIRMRIITSAAAVLVLAFISITYYFIENNKDSEIAQQKREQYVDDLCDYAMVNNAEIYDYLADENK